MKSSEYGATAATNSTWKKIEIKPYNFQSLSIFFEKIWTFFKKAVDSEGGYGVNSDISSGDAGHTKVANADKLKDKERKLGFPDWTEALLLFLSLLGVYNSQFDLYTIEDGLILQSLIHRALWQLNI